MKTEVEGLDVFNSKVKIPVSELSFRPSGYGLVVQDGKIALLSMKSTGKYFFPGGGIDLGETMEEAMRREVKEETGLDITEAKLIYANDVFFKYNPQDYYFHSIQFYYLCKASNTELIKDESVEDGEIEKPRWVEISSLTRDNFQDLGNGLVDRLLEEIQ